MQLYNIGTKTSLVFIQIRVAFWTRLSATVRCCRTQRWVRYLFAHRHILFSISLNSSNLMVARAKADSDADKKYVLTIVAYQSYCRPKLLSLLQSATLPGRGLRYESPAHAPRAWTRKPLGASVLILQNYAHTRRRDIPATRRHGRRTRLKPVYHFGFWCRSNRRNKSTPSVIRPRCRRTRELFHSIHYIWSSNSRRYESAKEKSYHFYWYGFSRKVLEERTVPVCKL